MKKQQNNKAWNKNKKQNKKTKNTSNKHKWKKQMKNT